MILDPERADVLQSTAAKILRDTEINAFLVFDLNRNTRCWEGMRSFGETLDEYRGDGSDVLDSAISIFPEDNATIIFTSGKQFKVFDPFITFLTSEMKVQRGSLKAS